MKPAGTYETNIIGNKGNFLIWFQMYGSHFENSGALNICPVQQNNWNLLLCFILIYLNSNCRMYIIATVFASTYLQFVDICVLFDASW